MLVNIFLNKENLTLLWDIILEDDTFKTKSKDIILRLNNVFNNNINKFCEDEKSNTDSLMEINKKFINIMLDSIKKFFPKNSIKLNSKEIRERENDSRGNDSRGNDSRGNDSRENDSRVNDSRGNDSREKSITYQDIQLNRQADFEKQFTQRQNEFTDAMTLPVPKKPKFADTTEESIVLEAEMELAVKRSIAQRNYDIKQINNSYNNDDINFFLKPVETSLRKENEKLNIKLITIDNNIVNNKAYENDIVYLDNKKQITWAKPLMDTNISPNINENNLFSKLKQIQSTEIINNKAYENDNVYLENKKDITCIEPLMYTNISPIVEENNLFSKLKQLPSTEINDNDILLIELNNKIERMSNDIISLINITNKFEKMENDIKVILEHIIKQ